MDFSETDSTIAHCQDKDAVRAWLVCLAAGLFFFYEFFQLNIFDVINESLRRDFQVSAAALSWMSSTFLWADILFLLPAGIILDRFSTRRVILVAMLICITSTVGFAMSHTFIMACFFHFLSGLGNAFCFLSCVVLVSRWFPPRRQAFVIGTLVTMAFLGGMMAHTPFAYLCKTIGWRHSLFVDGIVGLVLFCVIYVLVQDRPSSCKEVNQNMSSASVGAAFLQALKNPQNWLAGIYTSFLNLPIMVLCALWGANYLEVVQQLSPMTASNIVSLIFVGSIFGCPLAGWLSDRQGRRKPMMLFGAVATLTLEIPLLLDINLSSVVLGELFFMLGLFTSTQVISYPLIAESNPMENTGASTGIASVLIMGGAGVAQVLFGVLMELHANTPVTHYKAGDFQIAMWLFPITTLIAIAAVGFLRESYCKR